MSGSVLCQEVILSGRNFVRQEYCQEGILSGRGFVRQEFCQAGVLSGRNFVRKGFCQEGILSGRGFVRQEFCQAGVLSGRNFVRKGFCQKGILSGRSFARKGFCQEGHLSGRDFVRKRALPGSGLCQQGRRVSFGVVCVVYFLFLGAGAGQLAGVRLLLGMEASQLPGGEGGMGASQLWSWVLLLSTFFFLGAGASQLWSWVLLLSTFFYWGRGRVSFRVVCCLLRGIEASQLPGWVCCLLRGTEASQLPGCVMSSSAGDGGESALELCVMLSSSFGGNGVKNWKLTDAT